MLINLPAKLAFGANLNPLIRSGIKSYTLNW